MTTIYYAYFLVGFCYAAYVGITAAFNITAILAYLGQSDELEISPKWIPALLVATLLMIWIAWPLFAKPKEPDAK